MTERKKNVWIKLFAEFNGAFEALQKMQFELVKPIIADLKAPAVDEFWLFDQRSIGHVDNAAQSFRKIAEEMAFLLECMRDKMRDFANSEMEDVDFEAKYAFFPEFEDEDD